MDTTEKSVNWTANAALMLSDIYEYIESQSGDLVASEYMSELIEFGNRLSTKFEHFSFCRNTKLQLRGYRCALFKKRYLRIDLQGKRNKCCHFGNYSCKTKSSRV